MTHSLTDLYQEVILDHNRHPRNFGPLPQPTSKAEGYNPLCGDRVTVYLKMDGDRIAEVSFEGTGCAISTASASIMTEVLKGKTLDEAQRIFEKFHQMVTGQGLPDPEDEDFDRLMVFHRLSEFPVRVKCATLVWHTLLRALQEKEGTRGLRSDREGRAG
ncbi:MAG TPA: SUF system NifU family Fe-S cluster assembly protein [Acidobacteriota bacterium]|nr:SUF system NifU family Fe-S cluster assembly protein [Acidobacteriota bacterium]HRV08363.1 SUF system NifU family Fe-S cluster assembly protein [Acidobacteriota bacterium]